MAAASGKIEALREAIEDYKDKNHMLVYCGSASMKDNDYVEGKPSDDEMRQIDAVTHLLGNQMGINVAQFTSRENAQKRKQLISSFDEGVSIQALIAIRCLDEGVNIPSVDKAFILASSTNPKEYVQRRGRVLRLYRGKQFAKIYDFITLPIALDDISCLIYEIKNAYGIKEDILEDECDE
ncbi:DNA or RNA helicases of superfamily II [Bacteroides xylanisolvens]|nr:DNA or RNA helicases of superfamily II [Bacteroides xylanisolvens]